jgi:hypothetical protein
MDKKMNIHETFTYPIVDGKWFPKQQNLDEET